MSWTNFLDEFDKRAEEATGTRPPHYGYELDFKQTWGTKDNNTQYMRIVTEIDYCWAFTFKFYGKLEGLEEQYRFLVSKKSGQILPCSPGQGRQDTAVVISGAGTPEKSGAQSSQCRHGQPLTNINNCKSMSSNIDSNSKKRSDHRGNMITGEYGLRVLEQFKHNMKLCEAHSYLTKKKVTPTEDLKIDTKGILYIPYVSVKEKHNIMCLQRVIPENGKYTKKIVKDHKAIGACYIFDGDDDIIYLCEGWATASVISRLTGKKTLAFIGTNGLKHGAKMLRTCDCDDYFVGGKNEYGLNAQNFIVVADNDTLKNEDGANPGLEAGAAVKAATGIPFIYPDFHNLILPENYIGSDFNDLMCDFGDEVAHIQLSDQTNKASMHIPKSVIDAHTYKEAMEITYGLHEHVDYFQCRNGKIVYRYKYDGRVVDCEKSKSATYYKEYVDAIIENPDVLVDFIKYSPGRTMLYKENGITYLNKYQQKNHVETENFLEIAKPFIELVTYICKGVDILELFLDWLSTLVQKPDMLMPIVPIILSVEKGRGKGLIIELIAEILGLENCASMEPKKLFDLGSKFNAVVAEKQLIYVEEISFNRTQYDSLKNLVTGKNVICNDKHIKEYATRRTCNYIFTGNEIGKLAFDADERRFLMIEIIGDPMPQEFYDNIGRLKDNSPEFLGAIYTYLATREIKNAMTHIPKPVLDFTTAVYAKESSCSAKASVAAQLLCDRGSATWTLSGFQNMLEQNNVGLSKTQAAVVLRNNGFTQQMKYSNGKHVRTWVKKLVTPV